MIQRGDQLIWLENEMPGRVVDLKDNQIQAKWKAGYNSPFSGGTFWGAEVLLGAGLVELVGENGHAPEVPEAMKEPVAPDLFERAFEMSFEL